MKAKIFLALAVVLIPLTMAYAQKVVIENGKVIIDASAILHTKVKKATNIPGIASNDSDKEVYYKFEVSKINNSTEFTNPLNATSWERAINMCLKIDMNGKGWRLPTKRELMLMWILKAELEQAAGFEKFCQNHYYFSATEFFGNQCYVISFNDGYSTWKALKAATVDNPFPSHVRCIRDLD